MEHEEGSSSIVTKYPASVQLGEKEVQAPKVEVAVVDEADIPQVLWSDHMYLGTLRVKLTEDWEIVVIPLRNYLLRWWKIRITRTVYLYGSGNLYKVCLKPKLMG